MFKKNSVFRKLSIKFGGVIATFALAVTTLTANSTCDFIIHQPNLPEGAEKLRKF